MKMKRLRGFRLGHKLVKVFKWIVRPGLTRNYDTAARFFSLVRRGANRLCGKDSDPGCGKKNPKVARLAKGYLAVYVGESNGEIRRVVVPVISFNHPLLGELLKEAERVYEFDNSDRITIPCRVSEFEKVQTRIAARNHKRPKFI